MSVLTGPEIRRIVAYHRLVKAEGFPPCAQWIEIDPYDGRFTSDGGPVGPNSYDLTLSDTLLAYCSNLFAGREQLLDARDAGSLNTTEWTIGPGGFVLVPGVLYLGSTAERVACGGLVPWLDGRSSVGRLGVRVHATAGRGDDGFDGHWTLEVDVVHPVRVYAGMRIAQMTFMTLTGERNPYRGRYQGQADPTPSRMWRDFV